MNHRNHRIEIQESRPRYCKLHDTSNNQNDKYLYIHIPCKYGDCKRNANFGFEGKRVWCVIHASLNMDGYGVRTCIVKKCRRKVIVNVKFTPIKNYNIYHKKYQTQTNVCENTYLQSLMEEIKKIKL